MTDKEKEVYNRRQNMIHQWKLLMGKGDLGAAEVLKKQLEKESKLVFGDNPNIAEKEAPVEKTKKKRGRPKMVGIPPLG